MTEGRNVRPLGRIDPDRDHIRCAKPHVVRDIQRERCVAAPVLRSHLLAIHKDRRREHHPVEVEPYASARHIGRQRDASAVPAYKRVRRLVEAVVWEVGVCCAASRPASSPTRRIRYSTRGRHLRAGSASPDSAMRFGGACGRFLAGGAAVRSPLSWRIQRQEGNGLRCVSCSSPRAAPFHNSA